MKSNEMLWDEIHVALGLTRQAVGVRFLYTEKQYEAAEPNELRRPLSYCTMVRMAGLGKSLKAGLARSACAGGSIATGLLAANAYKRTGNSYEKDNLRLYDTIGTARGVMQDMMFMDSGIYGLELRPLREFQNYNPDVVIFVLNAFAAMRLIQAYAFHHGLKTDFRMSGNQAFCSELTAVPFLKNDINFSALCSGTRYRCNWGPDEVGVGVAYNKLHPLVDGLMATMPETEPRKNKLRIQIRAEEKNLPVDVQFGREYFVRKLKRDW